MVPSFLPCLVLCTLSRAVPLRDSFGNDDQQFLFSVNVYPTVLKSSPTTTTSAQSSDPVSSVQRLQDVPIAINTPVGTSVWFAPDADDPTSAATPSSGRKTIPRPAFRQIVAAYYPDWTADQLPPEMVDFDKFDWVDFAFAVPDASTFAPKFLEYNSEDLLKRLVTKAHEKNKKVKLSIGGWTGSGHFSDAVSPANANKFAADIRALYIKFNVDGIDIDWEYPGEAGAPGNVYSSTDTANFLIFLRTLRSILPSGAYITVAAQVWPFVDINGEKSKNISAFAEVLDWVLLMNYDVWGSSSTPGPNAPFSNACQNSSQPEANAQAAITSWTAAGFPAHKIVLGIPAYGYVSKSEAQGLRTRRRVRDLHPYFPTPLHANTSESHTLPSITRVFSEAGSAESGQIQFKALVSQGVLVRNAPGSKPTFTGAAGFDRFWDACSSTPYLRSISAGQIVTYDDPESLGIKALFVKQVGILGVNMWDAHGDTAEADLIDGVRRNLGLE